MEGEPSIDYHDGDNDNGRSENSDGKNNIKDGKSVTVAHKVLHKAREWTQYLPQANLYVQ